MRSASGIDLSPSDLAAGLDWNSVAGDAPAQPEDLFVRRGQKGETVEYFQRRLARLSPLKPGRIDSVFGEKTEKSVAAFQRSRTPRVEKEASSIGPWTRSELDLAEVERAAEIIATR